MQDQGQNVLKAECKVSLPAVLVPREAQGERPSENARALLLHGVLKRASVHRYLTFALLRDASSPVVRRRLIGVCVGPLVRASEFELLTLYAHQENRHQS